MKPLAIVPLYKPDKNALYRLALHFSSSSIDCIFYCNSPCKILVQEITEMIPGQFMILGTERNLGTACAYNSALEVMMEDDAYSHICLFDQDSLPEKNFFNVLETLQSDIIYNAILCPPDKKNTILSRHNQFRHIQTLYNCLYHAKASGMVIPRLLIEEGLRFYEPLFVDYVDWLFCWQARRLGYLIIEIPQLRLASYSLGNPYFLLNLLCLYLPSKSRRVIQQRSALFLLHNTRLLENAPHVLILRILLRLIIIPTINFLEDIHILTTLNTL